jgi:hypothetical protein
VVHRNSSVVGFISISSGSGNSSGNCICAWPAACWMHGIGLTLQEGECVLEGGPVFVAATSSNKKKII